MTKLAPNRGLLVKEIADVSYELENINWTFDTKRSEGKKNRLFDCRKYHWFPATFVPELPYTLIELLSYPGGTVYDPFSGIGTTYFQALSLCRYPLATENCTPAVEFMKSMLVLFNKRIDFDLVIGGVNNIASGFDSKRDYTRQLYEECKTRALVQELQKWYHVRTFNQLAYLFLEEDHCNDEATKATLRISISAILKQVSGQNRGWGFVADNCIPNPVQIKEKDAIVMFSRHSKRLLGDLAKHLECVGPGYENLYERLSERETIFHADMRESEVIPDNSVDLIITSPPYPNMTDYVKSQRLSYYRLGFSLTNSNQDLASEIGSRRRRHQKDSLEQYLKDMSRSNELLAKKVKVGGYVCFVMPKFGSDRPNDIDRKRTVAQVISDLGNYFVKEKELERTVPTIRRTQNAKWATLEYETIHIFRKEVD